MIERFKLCWWYQNMSSHDDHTVATKRAAYGFVLQVN